MRAQLILENGTIFEGRAFGHFRETVGEIVFNTSMAGYQEIITDPSNYGKIVMMTYPLVGNYGINLDDMESSGPKLKALVVREKADWPSNWRNEITLEDYLKQNRILGLEGIDTRALTRIIRSQASMKAIITFRELSKGQIKQHFQSFNNNMAVAQISTGQKYVIDGRGKKVGVIDLGITKSTLELLKDKDFKLTIYPYNVSVEEISNHNLDGVFLPNGPGDPQDLLGLIGNLKEILGKFPILGSGLGNEVLAISLGAKISSMKYGHRGINQPVKDLENNRIIISAQNHGYLIEEEGLPGNIEITHRNINDGSVEGIENKYLKAFGVEFYPDNIVLDKFINNMEGQMPKDNSIKKVLIIGSGPIVIGQGTFDYSGTQACKSIKEEGIEVVLVNSNPATIMTDRDMANKVYIEPLTVEFLEKIIARERPDSLIAGMGGQTGLNLAVDLHDKGILDRYNVRVIGTSIESIKEGEDRERFKRMMESISQPVIESDIITNTEDGLELASNIGYPVVARPAYTLGGSGGGIAENEEELKEILSMGIQLSPVGQVLIEKSVKGWKEIEYEVMRDSYGNSIVICNMENVDPVGIHTGDSIVVAPTQTLTYKEVLMLRKASLDILDAIDIKGGCNVQFALDPESFNYVVIEINPRVSRSSALASKATGYPIAKVAAKIALGYSLDEIKNSVTGKTYASSEPNLDYVVVKIPKWPFDKFFDANRSLGTKMMATGEVMAIATSFEAALLKGVRSLEINRYTLENQSSKDKTLEELRSSVQVANDERIFEVAQMLRKKYRVEMVHKITGIDMFFLERIKWIVDQEEALKDISIDDFDISWLKQLKKKGFSDKGIADLLKCSPTDIYKIRMDNNITPSYKMVDTCAGEFDAISPYYYSTYDDYNEGFRTTRKKVIVIGSGPIRIGQGIEFDYCCVHGIMALRNMGIETIMINNNPETVSTDFDIADKLYFEPLTEEDVLSIIELEKPDGIILQFGGQTAIKLSEFLNEMKQPILGTKSEQIHIAEDREKFDELMEKLKVERPKGKAVRNLNDGLKVAEELGYPILVRPSYVLGGQGMEITYNNVELEKYLKDAFQKDKKNPVLIDKYLMGREIEVDAICDGEDVLIPGIMEHLERAGVHSGDSISAYPSINISSKLKEKILEETRRIALALKVYGIINIQYIEYEDNLYIIEVNPRSSRTVPYISKVTNVPMIGLATRVMLGEKLRDMPYGRGIYKESELYTVKVPVFSTQKLPQVEMSLGPEMKSTGEVLGIGYTVEEALAKGFLAASIKMPKKNGTILATIRPKDKEEFLPIAKRFSDLGYKFIATNGTAELLREAEIPAQVIKKLAEGKPNILDIISERKIDLVINTPTKGHDSHRDGFRIRRAAIENGINVLTSLDTAVAMLNILEKGLDLKDIDVINLGGNSHV